MLAVHVYTYINLFYSGNISQLVGDTFLLQVQKNADKINGLYPQKILLNNISFTANKKLYLK